MYYAADVVEQLKQEKSIIVYGARIVAKEVAECLMGEPYGLKIDAFVVSNKEGNPNQLLGCPVLEIEEASKKYKDSLVILAVLERYVDAILSSLDDYGFSKRILLTFESDLWSELRGNFIAVHRKKEGRDFNILEEELKNINVDAQDKICHIYMAKCHLDEEVSTKEDFHEIPIQVGAALTDLQIADVRDNVGENISNKNQKYCELTALYWVWKNDKDADYIGLSHYRRHFQLNDEDQQKLMHSDIDVVLTIPILNFPSVKCMYENDHDKDDWKIMKEAIHQCSPEYDSTVNDFENGIYYSAYNMFIARRNIFMSYCEWLFPILEYCEIYCEDKEDRYQNRYIGFLAERLLSIYFRHHEKDWKIAYCKKTFLENINARLY